MAFVWVVSKIILDFDGTVFKEIEKAFSTESKAKSYVSEKENNVNLVRDKYYPYIDIVFWTDEVSSGCNKLQDMSLSDICKKILEIHPELDLAKLEASIGLLEPSQDFDTLLDLDRVSWEITKTEYE